MELGNRITGVMVYYYFVCKENNIGSIFQYLW